MPTPLGVLPSSQPVPNQRCQIAIGVYEGANNWQAGDAGTGLPNMGITYTTRYACFWVIRSNQIVAGVNGGWQRWDYSIYISPADVAGLNHVQVVSDVYDAGTVGWLSYNGLAVFQLAANTAYTAWLAAGYSSGGIQQTYGGSQYSRMIGVIHGEGVP
jgi:hypothetical protein